MQDEQNAAPLNEALKIHLNQRGADTRHVQSSARSSRLAPVFTSDSKG